jgi:hypothetical protein
MPPGAFAIVGLFAIVSLISGALAAWLIGPRRAWAAIVPAVAAFGTLYLIGHRVAVSIGPEIELFGFRISLPFDTAVAVAVAFVTAVVQGALVRLLQAKQRRTSGDRLA